MANEISPIWPDADYEVALAEVEQLWGAQFGSPDGDRPEVLATLIVAYEERRFPFAGSDRSKPTDCGTDDAN